MADYNQRDAARARRKLACSAFSRETAIAVAPSRVPRKSRLSLGGNQWHVTPRPHAEGKGSLSGALPLPSAWSDHSQRATARARNKLAWCTSSRETANAVPSFRAPREGQLILSLGGSSWHVAPCPHAEGEGPVAGAVPLPSPRSDRSQRGTARAQQQTRVVRFLPRDSERSGAPTRVTRKLADSGWPQLARRTTAAR